MNWYLKVLKQYADFSGRARRKEYWMFILFNMIFAGIAMILGSVLGSAIGGVVLYGLYILALLIPGLSSCCKKIARCWEERLDVSNNINSFSRWNLAFRSFGNR